MNVRAGSEVIAIDPGHVVVEPPSLMARVRHVRSKVQDCMDGELKRHVQRGAIDESILVPARVGRGNV